MIVYPILLAFLAYWYITNFGFGLYEALLIVSSYYVINITIGVALHRCWAHGAFSLNKIVEFVFICLATSAFQGPILKWSSDHTKHHAYTDTPKDPHSPLRFGGGIKGFLWSHIGWMLVKSPIDIDRVTLKRLSRNKLIMLQFKYYWQAAVLLNTVLPFAIGFACTGSYIGGVAGFIFLGIGRALQQHATFCVNSVVHFFGNRAYEKGGTAGDIAWLAPFLLGENWHSFHHAFPSDYRNGAKWYHLDVHKWIIWTLGQLGLAKDIKSTSEIRIIAQRKSFLSDSFKNFATKWSDLQKLYHQESKAALSEVCKTTQEIRSCTSLALKRYNNTLSDLSLRIKHLVDSQELSNSLIREFASLVAKFEYNVKRLEKEISSSLNFV